MILTVGVLIVAVLFFALLIVVSPLLYKRRIGVKYSFKNMFPFELNYKSVLKENFYTYLFLSLFVMASVGLFATFDRTYQNGFHIFSMISGIICALLIVALFIVPLTNLRMHVIFVSLFFTLNFASSASILVSAWKSNQEYLAPLKIVCIVIGIIILIAGFITIVNPRMTLNIRAEEKVNENGEKVLMRPKWVVLALTEWLHIILFIINMINITILTFAL